MKPVCSIVFLLAIGLLALPAGPAWACGPAGMDWEKSKEKLTDEHCDATGDSCLDAHPNEDCPPDTDGCGHCHCPGCGTTSIAAAGFFKNTLPETTVLSSPHSDRAANFCYRAPISSAHLAALFRPPIAP